MALDIITDLNVLGDIDLNKKELQNAVIQVLSTKPGSPATGQIFYDSDVNQVQVYTGSAWEGLVTETVDTTAMTATTSILNTSLVIGRDADNDIDFGTDNNIIFRAGAADQIVLKDGVLEPVTDDDVDLGSSSKQFKDGYFDGTLEADAITIGGTNILTGGIVTTLGAIAQDSINFYSSAADDPMLTLENNANDATGARILLLKDKGAAGADGDEVGEIIFAGDNDAQEQTNYAKIRGLISDASDGSEGGKFEVRVATHDGEMIPGLIVQDGDAEDEIDVTLGNTATSVTTVAGTLTMGSTATLTNAGLLAVADQSNVTGTGTLNSGAISSGFGAIDIGSSNLTATGTISLGATSFNDNNITNVGDLNADSISVDAAGTGLNIDFSGANTAKSFITVGDNLAEALVIQEGTNDYLQIVTTNSSEAVKIGHGVSGTAITIGHSTSETTIGDNLTVTGNLTVSGSTTTVDSTNLTVTDPLIKLNKGDTGSPARDQGLIISRGNGSSADADNRAMLWDESADEFVFADVNTEDATTSGNITIASYVDIQAAKVTASSLDISGNIDIDGTTNLDAVDIDGAVQLDSTLTIGANDQGYDVIFYGDTASANLTWDTSADDLILNGAARIVVPDGQLVLASTAVSSTAAELNLLDAGSSGSSVTLASGDSIIIGDASASNATKKVLMSDVATFTNGSIEGTGALNSGSITSGFGAIDNGTSGIRTDTFVAETSFVPDADDGATLGSANLNFSDLYLADGANIYMGDDQDVLITHDADKGVIMSHAATGDDKPFILTLKSNEATIADNEVIAGIEFIVDEDSGGDSDLVAAGIFAFSAGAFDSTNNRTDLVFTTGHSESAGTASGALDITQDMVLSSQGVLTVAGNITPAGIVLDGNTITGVDDSGEFTDDDAHIMTSAAINDRFGAIAGSSSIVTTGALNSGSITSGFGNIDNGSSTITTTGLISGGSLDIDDVLINGTTIGHTDDTDLMTVADGLLTVAGEISVTTLDIGGTDVTSTAAELNILDGVTTTTAEINLIDGGTSRTTNAVADGDGILHNNGGTMEMTKVETFATYFAAECAALREKVFVLNNSVSGVASSDNITYTVTHSLNTRNVMVEVIRNGANSGDYSTVLAEVKRNGDDTIQVVFASARTAGDYTVMIRAIG